MNNSYHAAAKWLGLMIFPLLYVLPPVRSHVNWIAEMLFTADFNSLKQLILSFGIWAPFISIGLTILQALIAPLPSLVLVLVNAWIFGWLKGAFYSWLGSLLGAAFCFKLARWYGRPGIEKLFGSQKIKRADSFFRRYGTYAVLIARLTPILSFDLISYAAGFTAIDLRTFLLATAVGQTPALVLYSLLGNNLSKGIMQILWAVPILLLLIMLGIAARQWLSRNTTT